MNTPANNVANLNYNTMSNNVMSYMTSFIVGGGGSGGQNTNGGLNYNMIFTCLLVMSMTWVFTGFKAILEFLFGLVVGRMFYTVKLSNPDQIYCDFMEWVTTQKMYGTKGVSALKRPNYTGLNNANSSNNSSNKRSALNLTLVPTGTQFFIYSRYLVSMTRVHDKTSGQEWIDVNIYGGGLNAINKLLNTAHEYCVEKNKNKTQVYHYSTTIRSWELISNQPGRPFDSVILESDVKDKLIKDFEKFINDSQWYRNSGVPYRRGYILHGPPGCGKTSFILALAHRFEKNIAVVNMNKDIDDNSITSIIQKTPVASILVMEDIDAAFKKMETSPTVKGLTFAGLLNAIDGLASSDGRILIMTTNHLDRLKPSLIRPGRVDVIVEFKNATHYQITQMFKRFFEEVDYGYLKGILEAVPENSVSISQIQGWFIIHRSSPETMVDTIEKYYKAQKGNYTNTYGSNESSETTTPSSSPPPTSSDNTSPSSPKEPNTITKRLNPIKIDTTTL